MTKKGSKEFRRANLVKLLERFHSQREFASLTDMAASNVSHIVTGQKGMGDSLARRIESMLNLPDGWIDMPSDAHSVVPTIIPAQLSDALEDLMALPESERISLVNYIHELAAPYRKKEKEDAGLESPGSVDRPLGALGSDGYEEYDRRSR